MKTRPDCPFACRLVLSLISVGLFGPPAGAEDTRPVKNLLENGGLEEKLDPATSLPVGWQVTQKPESSYKVEVVDGGRTGKKCLRISGEGKNVQIRLKHLPTEREKRSVISGWMKVVAGEGTVALSHRYEDAAGRPIAGSMSIGGINAKNTDWTMTSMIDQPQQLPPGIEAGFIIGASGKIDALVDDLVVFYLPVTPDDLLWAAGDFESPYDHHLAYRYTTVTSAGGKVEISPEEKRPANGRYCLRMKANGDWATTSLYPVKYDAGKVYTLTGKVRVNSGRAGIRIDYYNDDKRTKLLGSSTMDVTESKDWQLLSVDTRDNNQNGATHITATAVCHGDAEAFFDQLVLIAK
jgi:hypothetical protein